MNPGRILSSSERLRLFVSLSITYLMLLTPIAPLAAEGPGARGIKSRTSTNSNGPAKESRESGPPAPQAAPAPATFLAPEPLIVATKKDSFADPDSDGKAEPGETINYTVTIKNNGTADATGVVFNDTPDPNTTLVPGSIAATPIAVNDTYSAIGNVRIHHNGPGLLSNDRNPITGDTTGLTASGGTTSTQNGSVTINADGSFDYTSAPGFTGTDTFTYTVTDANGKTDTATATITVTNTIWFINASAPAGGNGTLAKPFNSIAAYNSYPAAKDPGDIIYFYSGSYSGNLTLVANQKIIGQAVGLATATGITVPTGSDPLPGVGAMPSLASSVGSTVTLSTGNTIRGVDFGNSAVADIIGNTFGMLTTSVISFSGTGQPLNLTTGTLNASVGNVSQTSGTTGLSLSGVGGTLDVTGATNITTSGGPGIVIQSLSTVDASFAATTVSRGGAAGPAVSFSGSTGPVDFSNLNITNSNGAGLAIANSSNIGTSSGVINATGGPALDVTTATTSALNLTFNSTTSTNSTTNGVNLNNVTGLVSLGSGSIGGAQNAAFNVSGGTATVNYGGTITQNTANQRVVNISGTGSGSSINLIGTITGGRIGLNPSSTGININNAVGSIAFSSLTLGTSIDRATNQQVTITGGSANCNLGSNLSIYTNNVTGIGATDTTGTITIGSGTIDTNQGTAVSVSNASVTTPLAISLTKVTSSGGSANGIILNRTSGFFTITGTGTTAGSGGTIANKTGANGSTTQGTGVFLSNATNITLKNLQLNGFENYAIKGTSVDGFTLDNTTINGTNGNNAAGPSEEGSIRFDNLAGTASITNSNISGGFVDNIRVQNTTGTLNRLTLNNVTVGANSTGSGNDGLHFEAFGIGTVMNLTVQNSFFTSSRGDLLDAIANNNSTMDVVLRSNKFSNNHSAIVSGGGGVIIQGSSTGANPTVTYEVSCNTFRDALGIALNIFKGNGGGTFTGSIVNNAIGVSGVSGSGSAQASGIAVTGNGTGTHTVLIKDNRIRQYGNDAGIYLKANDGSSVMNASVFGNTTAEPTGFAFAGLFADIGAQASDTNTLNLVLGSAIDSTLKNDFSGGDPSGFSDVSLITSANADINLSRNGSVAGTAEQVIKDNNLNPAGTGVSVAGAVSLVNTLPPVPPTVAFCNTVASINAPVDATLANAKQVETLQKETAVAGLSSEKASGSNSAQTAALAARLAEMIPAKQVANQSAYTAKSAAFSAEKQSAGARTAKSARTLAPVYAPQAPGSVSVNIGTLPAGKTVTVTFQVTVNKPFGSAQLQVVNQGTVSGSNFASVLTDDPDTPAANDPTITPIASSQLSIRDASIVEPASGTKSMIFTVTLNAPASGPLSVDYTTADQAPGAGHAVAGVDYTPTSGILSFSTGEMIKTIAVPVFSDATAEGDETFLFNLSNPTNAQIMDGQAVGTIKATRTPSIALISELRTSGPGGPGDDFVEIYNNTDDDIVIEGSNGSAGWSIVATGNGCGATPVIVATIPNETLIPARGHYLLTGSQYSLSSYATGDQTLDVDIDSDSNVALFDTASIADLSTETRLDAIGFGGNVGNVCDLLSEGTNQPAALGSTAEHSYLRKTELDLGVPRDTDENSTDFIVVSTTPSLPVGSTANPIVGAPGPENRQSPTAINGFLTPGLVEPNLSSGVSPNRTRSTPSLSYTDPNTGLSTTFPFGTLGVRRTYTNNTGVPVTRLRFRIIEITAGTGPAGMADTRAITSLPETITTSKGSFTIQGTFLEQAPDQQEGGGFNSTLSCCTTGTAVPGERTVTLAQPLMPGETIAVQWLLGLKQKGNFRFYVNIEGLTEIP